jgi:hypothetical protein
MPAAFSGGFSAEQFVEALLEALRNRNVRASPAQVELHGPGGFGSVRLALTADWALVPSEAEWIRIAAAIESGAPRPAARWLFAASVREVSESRDEVARIQFVAQILDAETIEVHAQTAALGTKDLPGLKQAMADALRGLPAPMHNRYLWFGRPGET